MVKSNVYHSVDIDIACLCGVNAALVYSHMVEMIKTNHRNRIHFHNNKTWTNEGIAQMTSQLPYLSQRKVKAGIKKLLEKKLIIRGKKTIYTHTNWYALEVCND